MSLVEYRNKIDELDEKILKLLEERMKIVDKIARAKMEEGLPIENHEREVELIDRLIDKSSEGLAKYNEMVFREIISASKAYQNEKLDEE